MLRFTPHGRKLRRHPSSDAGKFSSLLQETGGASGVGPPQLIKARRVMLQLLCRDKATPKEHLSMK